MTPAQVRPCELPCPKCGNADVLRRFYARHAALPRLEKYEQAVGKYAGVNGWDAYATRDHLRHLCRCCQFEWQTLPLPKVKTALAASGTGAPHTQEAK